jgi:hypothetical protein
VDVPQTENTITLFRPVGAAEMELIRMSGFSEFPPRLPSQSVFYPVLSQEYAEEIARDWNTKDPASGFAGFVTRFHVRAEFLRQFTVHTVGTARHREYWIPAEDLPNFNENLVGPVEVVAEFR